MSPGGRDGGSSVAAARDGIRGLILQRRMSPGEQIRQEELAKLFNLSRSPIREALRSLESDGLVIHRPNRGYFVNRLSAEALRQNLIMRRLLEDEVLRACKWPGRSRVAELRRLNTQIAAAAERHERDEVLQLNRAFHFDIFSLSGLDLIVEEIDRLWMLSEPYRSLDLRDEQDRERQIREHDEIIEAIALEDASLLVERSDRHRQTAGRRILDLLAGPPLG